MKSELSAFNVKINKCFVTQYPSKRWGFVGHVPMELAFIDATKEQIANLKFGGAFGPKTRSFDTKENALLFAKALNIEVN